MEPDFKEVERIIAAALAEDIGTGDATTQALVPASALASLSFVAREPLVVCGIDVAARVFLTVAPEIKILKQTTDGQHVAPQSQLMVIQGPARAILTAERTALNLMQRMSAVATLTARYVKAVEGTRAIILDTRKTMPGLRVLDKYAVKTGGTLNHRMRLDDGILIKDNHIALCGGVREAFQRATKGNPRKLPIEIECDSLTQVQEALEAGVEAILLDNMSLETMREAVQLVAGHAMLEASGNVTLENVRAIAETGVNFISVGRLTHSVPNVDIGLDVVLTD
jgi:nicotinate-nucleotide pyrophosphorylase (carboxylating)